MATIQEKNHREQGYAWEVGAGDVCMPPSADPLRGPGAAELEHTGVQVSNVTHVCFNYRCLLCLVEYVHQWLKAHSRSELCGLVIHHR